MLHLAGSQPMLHPSKRYGYIKNHKKTVKNGQARARESEEYKKKPKNQSRSQKNQALVKSWSTKKLGNSKAPKDYGRDKSVKSKPSLTQDQAHATSAMVKAQRGVGFALDPLTELAQHVTSKNDKLAILRCPQCDPTAQERDQ
ncbi:hypothetical protein Tco_1371908 [Tanacetum coccineum]